MKQSNLHEKRPCLKNTRNRATSRFLGLATVIMLLGVRSTVVQAQSLTPDDSMMASESSQMAGSPSPEESQPTEAILERTTVSPQIKELSTTLLGQFEEYRTAEREYQLAKGQMNKLKTLISLEEAVKATKKSMQAREVVLSTYVKLVKLTLLETNGIPLTLKSETLQSLDAALGTLQTHRQKIDSITTREQVATTADEFATIIKPIEQATYYAQALVSIGELQSVYDSLIALAMQVKREADATAVSAVQQAERDRAARETNLVLQNIQQRFATMNTTLYGRENKRPNGKELLTNNSGVINEIYTGLSRAIDFLDEILRI